MGNFHPYNLTYSDKPIHRAQKLSAQCCHIDCNIFETETVFSKPKTGHCKTRTDPKPKLKKPNRPKTV